jgi:hypothetical protein
MAQIHALPTDWYDPIQAEYMEVGKPSIVALMKQCPPHAIAWNIHRSFYHTGRMVSNLPFFRGKANYFEEIWDQMIESGVCEKLFLCEAFYPRTLPARRRVTCRDDFVPKNFVYTTETKRLYTVDYDLIHVAPAVCDFGKAMHYWLGTKWTTYEYREVFVREYLTAAGFPAEPNDVNGFLFDMDVYAMVHNHGLFVLNDDGSTLLRGIEHKSPLNHKIVGSPDDSPTALELIDLLGDAVNKLRADNTLFQRCLEEGIVRTMVESKGVGSQLLFRWLEEMVKKKNLWQTYGILRCN